MVKISTFWFKRWFYVPSLAMTKFCYPDQVGTNIRKKGPDHCFTMTFSVDQEASYLLFKFIHGILNLS